jgi:hypothetical protein
MKKQNGAKKIAPNTSASTTTSNPMPSILVSSSEYQRLRNEGEFSDLAFELSEWFSKHGFSIPVRHPAEGEIIRISPNDCGHKVVCVINDEATGQKFWVTLELVLKTKGEYLDLYANMFLALVVSMDGALFIWPLKDWRMSGATGHSADRWVRATIDDTSEVHLSDILQAGLPEVIWPQLELYALEDIAFQSRMIDAEHHPVHERARRKRDALLPAVTWAA